MSVKTVREIKTAARLYDAGADLLENSYEVSFPGFPTLDGELLAVRAIDFTIPSRSLSLYDVHWGHEKYSYTGGKNDEEKVLTIQFRADVRGKLYKAFTTGYKEALYQSGKPFVGIDMNPWNIKIMMLGIPDDSEVFGETFHKTKIFGTPEIAFKEESGNGIIFEIKFIYFFRSLIETNS